MGNCQAAEAATVVVQHPGGRVQRLYWATSAAEVMRANPGHYVALVTLRVAEERQDAPGGERRTVRLTRVKLLKPKETLLLGHVYRLITTQGASSVRKNNNHSSSTRPCYQLMNEQAANLRCAAAEVTKAVRARKEEKQRKAQQQLLESRPQGTPRGAAEEEDDEAALDASLDQVIITWIRLCLSNSTAFPFRCSHARSRHDPCAFNCFFSLLG
jgi:hypothetical protein